MPEPLRMLQMSVDPASLHRHALSQGKAIEHADLGLLLHGLLAELFGKGVAQPFRARPQRNGSITVFAYSRSSDDSLRERAALDAGPMALKACDLDSLASKPMPVAFTEGRRLGFEIRVCPIVRLREAITSTAPGDLTPRTYRAGSELDSFHRYRLSATDDDTKTRPEVYTEWLAERLAPGAELLPATVELTGFRRLRILRGGHGPAKSHGERPDALMTGDLVVRDPPAFDHAVSEGVGRHKAFGFGMLLLRSPQS